MNRRAFFGSLVGAASVAALAVKLQPEADFPDINFIDFPETIIGIHPWIDRWMVFTPRGIYRLDGAHPPFFYRDRRLWANAINTDWARITPYVLY